MAGPSQFRSLSEAPSPLTLHGWLSLTVIWNKAAPLSERSKESTDSKFEFWGTKYPSSGGIISRELFVEGEI